MVWSRGRHEVLNTPCGLDAMDYLNVRPGVRPVASGSSLAALAPNEDAVGQVSAACGTRHGCKAARGVRQTAGDTIISLN